MGIFEIITFLFIPLICYAILKKNGYCKNKKEIISMLSVGGILVAAAFLFQLINIQITAGMVELGDFYGVSLVLLVLGASFIIFPIISFIRNTYVNHSAE